VCVCGAGGGSGGLSSQKSNELQNNFTGFLKCKQPSTYGIRTKSKRHLSKTISDSAECN